MGSSIRAIIFDLDGTLADTMGDISAALNAALRELGLPLRNEEEVRAMVGWGAARLAELALPEALRRDAALAAELAGRFQEAYRATPWALTRPYPGMVETLAGLRDRDIPFAVNTNKPEIIAIPVLENLLGSLGPVPLAGARPGLPKKPDPAGALAVLSELSAAAKTSLSAGDTGAAEGRSGGTRSIDPADCVYLGDSAVDIRTARAGGFRALGAAWGFRGPEELAAAGADAILERPLDLLDFIDGRSN